jgi:serine/threonine protein kinase/flagellar motor switch/type III secretory pathway protein FliN
MVDVFHPNWIISHEVIREPGLALVGEYLDGAPFSINDEPVPIEAVAFILREILTGLSYLHERKQFHGNLKPSNVILCRDGAVKLLDWGMQKVLNAPREKISSVWYGTLSHMAPETHHGDWGPKADIYSAGLLAWELLAGRPACPHQNIDAQRRWHSSMGPMGIELVRSETPQWLASIITAMCARDVEQRPENAMQILEKWEEGYVLPGEEEQPKPAVNIPTAVISNVTERPRARRRRKRIKERRAGERTNSEPVTTTKKPTRNNKRRKSIDDIASPLVRKASVNAPPTPRTKEKKRSPQLDSQHFFSALSAVFQEQILSMNLPNGVVMLRKNKPLLLTEVISNKGFVGSLISLELEFSTLGPRGYVLLSYDLIHNLFNRYSDRDAPLKNSTRNTLISHADRRSLDRFIAPLLERIQKYFQSVVVHSAKLSVPDTQGKRQVGVMQVGIEDDLYGFLAVGIPTEFFSPAAGEGGKNTSVVFSEEENLMEELLDVSVSMRCALPSFQLSYQSLQELQIGSILPLPKNWNKQLRVIINNKQTFSGEYGVDEGFHAVLIHTQHRPKK